MAAPATAHALRGLNSQQAAQAVAAAYVAAGLRTDSRPAARKRFVERRDEWLERFSEWLEPDWWPMWPEAEQDALLDELEAARARYASSRVTLPYEDEAVRPSRSLQSVITVLTPLERAASDPVRLADARPHAHGPSPRLQPPRSQSLSLTLANSLADLLPPRPPRLQDRPAATSPG